VAIKNLFFEAERDLRDIWDIWDVRDIRGTYAALSELRYACKQPRPHGLGDKIMAFQA
jgi:hypothetical protein